MYSIYKITNKINGKIYIGLTKRGVYRWKEHCRSAVAEHPKLPIHCAIKKYGKGNFSFDVLMDNLIKEDAIKKEVEIIEQLNSINKDIGYNVTKGGEGGFGLTGNKHGMFGKKRPDLILLNKSREGIKLSKEHIELIRSSGFGRNHSAESIKNMSSIKKMAWKNGVYDSEDYRSKIGNKKGTGGKPRKKIKCNETGVIYGSISEAARCMDFPKSAISNISGHLAGKWPRAYGNTYSFM